MYLYIHIYEAHIGLIRNRHFLEYYEENIRISKQKYTLLHLNWICLLLKLS